MVVHSQIMHQPFDEGDVCHEQTRVYDKFECGLKPINILLERLLGMLNDLEVTIPPL